MPAMFTKDCHLAIEATVNTITSKNYFSKGDVFEEVRNAWEVFQRDDYPDSDHVGVYLDTHKERFKLPLLKLITLALSDEDAEDHYNDFDLQFVHEDIHAAADNAVTGLEAAALAAYNRSLYDIDSERLVALNPSLDTAVATHSVMHENRGRPLPRIPPRLPMRKNQHPDNNDLIQLLDDELRRLMLLDEVVKLTDKELKQRLEVAGLPKSLITIIATNKFHLVCT